MFNVLLISSLLISIFMYKKISSGKLIISQREKVLFPFKINQNSYNSSTIFSETTKKIIDIKKFKNEKIFRDYEFLLSINNNNIVENIDKLVTKLKDPNYALMDKLHEVILQNIDFSDPTNIDIAILLDENNTPIYESVFPETAETIDEEIAKDISTIVSKAKHTEKEFSSIEKLNSEEKLSVIAAITDETKSLAFVHLLKLFINEKEQIHNRIIALNKLDGKNPSCCSVMANVLEITNDVTLAKHILFKFLKSNETLSFTNKTFIHLMNFENITIQSIVFYMNSQTQLSPSLVQLQSTDDSCSKLYDQFLMFKSSSENERPVAELIEGKTPEELIVSMNKIKKYDHFILGKLEKLITHSNQKVVGKALFLLNCHHGDKIFSTKFLPHEDKKKKTAKKDPILNNYILNIPENIWSNSNYVVDFLESKASSPFPILKEQIAYTLGNFETKKSRSILRNFLQEKSIHVNYAALISLTKMGTSKEIPFILQMLTSYKDEQNIQIAKNAINTIKRREEKRKFKKIAVINEPIAV